MNYILKFLIYAGVIVYFRFDYSGPGGCYAKEMADGLIVRHQLLKPVDTGDMLNRAQQKVSKPGFPQPN